MPSILCKVTNIKGMHARAAAKIVNLVAQYEANAILTHKNSRAPGDSLLKLLTLNAPMGSQIHIETCGPESQELINKLESLFAIGFGE